MAALLLFLVAAISLRAAAPAADGAQGAAAASPRPGALLGAPIAGGCPACAVEPPAPAPANLPKTTAPRTLPEAIHAYGHCLHLRALGIEPPPAVKTKGEEKGKEKPKDTNGAKDKEEAAPGNRGKTGESDKEDKGNVSFQDANGGGSKAPSTTPGDRGKIGDSDRDEKEEKNGKKDNDTGGNGKDDKEEAGPAWYSAHAQATVVTQIHQHYFHSPYVGANSLLPSEPAATSMTGTLFLDVRLWGSGSDSGELVFNPEIAGGRGFSNVIGIAGFPNGEITRVGVPQPTPYIARLFLRQTWGLGGEQEKVEEAFNQLAGTRDVDRLTVLVGKFPGPDLADDNGYSHDPRIQFLNWSAMYNGAWDYPSNVRGYTYGFGLDFNRKTWALRYGVFVEPESANSAPLDPHFLKALGHVLELEERYRLCEHPGHLRLLGYLNHAHMGNYREALALMPVDPDITLTRAYRIKYGFGMSWDQELSSDLGVFSRLGWNDGQSETWAFTEIDETAALGLSLKGRCWCRPQDVVGLAGVCNGLAPEHRAYLAAGGLGFLLGDGRLNYGLEKIVELYYNLEVHKNVHVLFDFQEVDHPGYNRDRGPVAVGSVRVHFEF